MKRLAFIIAALLAVHASAAETIRMDLQDNAASNVIVAQTGGNGTLQGGDNTNTPGKSVPGPGGAYPLALQLNGTDDYIDAGANGSLDSSATGYIAVWAKATAAGTAGVFGTRASNAARIQCLRHTDNKWYVAVGNAFPTYDYSATDWGHWCQVYDNGASPKQKFYFNGQLVSITGTVTTATTLPASQGNVNVGRGVGSVFSAWSYAGLRVGTGSFSQSDVQALYEHGISNGQPVVIITY